MLYNAAMPRPRKGATAYIAARVSLEAKGLLLAAAEHSGLDQTSALEIVLRDYARRHKLEPLPVTETDRVAETKSPYTPSEK